MAEARPVPQWYYDIGKTKSATAIERREEMEWQIILALVLAVPIILLPVVFVWYLNFRVLQRAVQEAREKTIARAATEKVHRYPRGLSRLG